MSGFHINEVTLINNHCSTHKEYSISYPQCQHLLLLANVGNFLNKNEGLTLTNCWGLLKIRYREAHRGDSDGGLTDSNPTSNLLGCKVFFDLKWILLKFFEEIFMTDRPFIDQLKKERQTSLSCLYIR